MNTLNDIITDTQILSQRYIVRNGFVFVSGFGKANIFDTLLIRNPPNAPCSCPQFPFSTRTLDEHIQLINQYKLKSAYLIAEDINFINQCPSLSKISVTPSNTAENQFDFSPLYSLPEITHLYCATEYGNRFQLKSSIDYSQINGLLDLNISGQGHFNFHTIPTLQRLAISKAIVKSRDLNDIFASACLQNLTVIQSNIQTLNGIEKSNCLSSLSLWYNRSLCDISPIISNSKTLKKLSIEACAKISDFSFLEELESLEELELFGSNTLPDLNFVNKLTKLKKFCFSMKIANGDLTPCLKIPYAYCQKTYNYYNLKDKDLPKK